MTRGAPNPSVQVVITHESHVRSQHLVGVPLGMNGTVWSRTFRQTTPHNLITRVLTICHEKPPQSTHCVGEKTFDLIDRGCPHQNCAAIAIIFPRSRSSRWDRYNFAAIAIIASLLQARFTSIASRSLISRRDQNHRAAIAITASRSRSSRRDRDHRAAIAITSPRSRSPRRYRGRD